jgi:hypothetical protein
MRTTRRPRWPLGPALAAYTATGIPTLESLTSISEFGPRINAVLRARAIWLNQAFLDRADDVEFSQQIDEFYDQVVSPPLFAATLRRQTACVRRGVEHLLGSSDSLSVRIHRCLNRNGAFAASGVGPAFWSAVVQALDPLRLPAWTPEIVKGARRLGLIQRKRIWYGDIVGACEQLRKRDPRLTASHVDHFLTLVGRMTKPDLYSGGALVDPLPALIEAERADYPLRQRLSDRRPLVAAARTALLVALRSEDAELAVAALESINCRLGSHARAWDMAALLQWIAWIWHDDDPLGEAAACECEATGAGRCLTAAVLHLRAPERYPPWSDAAAAGLARLADAPAESYPMYVEGVAALCQRYWLHPFEVPAILGRLANATSPATS